MDWKTHLENYISELAKGMPHTPVVPIVQIEKLIETEVIEKLIDDAMEITTAVDWGDATQELEDNIKQQLKAKWLENN